VYDGLNGTSKPIFDNKISIGSFMTRKTKDESYLIISACNSDSNKDKFLNAKDLQGLFIYDINDSKLDNLKLKENHTTLEVFQPDKSNDLIVHFGIDRNKNGKFERSREPMVFYKINLLEMKLEEFVSEKDIIKMQELLEGK
ncbi:MAG: hypothetical protein AAFO82_01575, partial [Bacteroidota bacterium]